MATLNADAIVKTTHGKVRGKQRKTIYGVDYYCFDGIPYAKPPIGELRFKSPIEIEPWNEILDCTQVAQKSVQYNRYNNQIEGSEDCLYLNVYAKQLKTAKLLPVMVYIHGGGFNTGDATRLSWGPDYFMMKSVVFITIGYRLGVLGFLSLSDPALQTPGNAGLKDIIHALKWIKSNCMNFNGDPENITFFGHSAGSNTTHCLLLSDQAKQLFHKAILMSGFQFYAEKVPNLEYRLAKHLGYDGENNDLAVFKFLANMDAKKLVGYNLWTQEELDNNYEYTFGPVVEPYECEDTILCRDPIELIQNSWSNNIPVMVGCTSFEGLLCYNRFKNNPEVFEMYKEKPEYVLCHELQNKCNAALQQKIGREAIKLHFGEKEVDVQNINCMLEIIGYRMWYYSLYRFIKVRLKYSLSSTFLYRFDLDSPTFNLYRIKHLGTKIRGVAHVDELSYLFLLPNSYRLHLDSIEYKTIKRMINFWTEFSRSSNPNSNSSENSIANLTWDALKPNEVIKCINISENLTLIKFPELEKCYIWDGFYKQAGILS